MTPEPYTMRPPSCVTMWSYNTWLHVAGTAEMLPEILPGGDFGKMPGNKILTTYIYIYMYMYMYMYIYIYVYIYITQQNMKLLNSP